MDGRTTRSLIPALLFIKMGTSDSQTRSPPTHNKRKRRVRTRAEHSGLQGVPPLMETLVVHQNIQASDSKLTPCLGTYYISSPQVMDKLNPINSNARLQSSLNQGFSLLSTRITLVGTKHSTSRDKCTFNLSTELSALQILRQGSSPLASQTAVQLTQCFRSTLLQTHKLETACAIKMAAESDE